MTNQDFIDGFDRLVEEYEKTGSFEKIKELKDKYGAKYNNYKREIDGITQEEFLKNSIKKKKEELSDIIKK